MRVALIFTYRNKFGTEENDFHKKLLVSAPASCEFELHILKTGIDLIKNLLWTKYPTQLVRDQKLLEHSDLNWRTYLAVTHRATQKEAL